MNRTDREGVGGLGCTLDHGQTSRAPAHPISQDPSRVRRLKDGRITFGTPVSRNSEDRVKASVHYLFRSLQERGTSTISIQRGSDCLALLFISKLSVGCSCALLKLCSSADSNTSVSISKSLLQRDSPAVGRADAKQCSSSRFFLKETGLERTDRSCRYTSSWRCG